MSLEGIKTNLWKGGLGFSKVFPAIGTVLGAAFTLHVLKDAFPRLPRLRRR